MPSTRKPRILWIDAARAFAVIAVVLLHYLGWNVIPNDSGKSAATEAWRELSNRLWAIRMPLLFLVSGIVASSAIVRKHWVAGANYSIRMFYYYAVWGVLTVSVGALLSVLPVPSVQDVLVRLFVPTGILWFLWALGVWALIVLVTRRLPTILIVVAALALSFGEFYLAGVLPEMVGKTLRYGVYFVLGARLKDSILDFMRSPILVRAPVAAIAWEATEFALSHLTPGGLDFRIAAETRNVSAVLLTLVVISILCSIPVIAKTGEFVGQRTLDIFVLHQPVYWVLISIPSVSSVLLLSELRWIWPVIGVLALVLLSLLIGASAKRGPARFLFTVPACMQFRVPAPDDTPQLVASTRPGGPTSQTPGQCA